MYTRNGWTMEVDTLYMMSICKFSSLAFAYEDGAKKDEDIKNNYWRSKKILEKPTLLETFTYIFYFPSSIIGPSFEFCDFYNFIYKRKEYSNIPKMRCIKAALKKFLTALICMLSFVFFKNRLEFFWVISDEFAEKSLLYKFLYYMISAGLVIRAKYYTGFLLSESSVIFCGLSYDIKKIENNKNQENDKKLSNENTDENNTPEEKNYLYIDDFTKIESIKIYNFEMEIDPNQKVNYWNRTVHYWLKYQVFFRLINLEHKTFNKNFQLASLIAFVISAIWHGFYPGYYLFFVQLYFIQQIGKMLEEKFDFFKKIKNYNFILQFTCNLISIFVIGSLGFAFCILDIFKAIKFYKYFYFLPNIFVFVLYFSLVFLTKRKKHIKQVNPTFENYNTLTGTKSGDKSSAIKTNDEKSSLKNEIKKEL